MKNALTRCENNFDQNVTIYDLLYQAAHKAPTGVSPKQLAEDFGISLNAFNKRINPEYEDRKFPVEDLAQLCATTGDFSPLHFICAKAGGVFIRLPHVENNGMAVHLQCMDAVKNFGSLMEDCSEALADGVISKKEADEIDESGYHALCAIMLLLKEAHHASR